MRAVVCDKCDLILPFDGNYHKVSIDNDLMISVDKEYHLCDRCLERMREWFEQKVVE